MRIFLIWLALAVPAFAVEPNEILDDPVLEERARDLSQGLRCLVCRNESIDESNADLARDLRLLVRERLVAGDTDDEVIEFVVARYGEYVLLTPTRDGANLILWWAGPAGLILALVLALAYLRTRRPGAADDALTDDEQARLERILDE